MSLTRMITIDLESTDLAVFEKGKIYPESGAYYKPKENTAFPAQILCFTRMKGVIRNTTVQYKVLCPSFPEFENSLLSLIANFCKVDVGSLRVQLKPDVFIISAPLENLVLTFRFIFVLTEFSGEIHLLECSDDDETESEKSEE